MKRLVVFGAFLILMFSISFVMAAEGETDVEKVDVAYACLDTRVADGCSAIPADARAFALLTVDKCQTEIVADKIVSGTDEYWSNSDGQDLKLTAESILALQSKGVSTTAAEKWLMNQNKSPNTIEWFLEVDAGVSEGETVSCQVSYGSVIAKFDMGENKQLINFQSGGGVCLSLSASPFTNYFLMISNTQPCLDNEYAITCDGNFLSTLLFKKQGSTTLHVSKEAHAESAGGFTTEQIKSLCFHKNQQCDYEGSLWAALVLNYLHYDVSSFMPYLIVMAEDNPQYMPDSFLYSLTGYQEFKTNLLALQNQQHGYWLAQGTVFDKFYDTAAAGLGLRGQAEGVEDAKRYLLDEAQNEDGCWGSTRDTGFLLYAFWESFVYSGGDGFQSCDTTVDCPVGLICELGICIDEGTPDDDLDCATLGYYCMASISCEGNLLDNYNCAFPLSCCDTPEVLETCAEKGGKVCSSSLTCSSSVEDSTASDLDFGESFCLNGDCKEPETKKLCSEVTDASCESICDEGYSKDSSYYCAFGDVCCVKDETSGGISWWIWVLLGLIVLIVLGIIFRDKLRMLWMRMTSKKSKGPFGPGAQPRFPGGPPRGPPMTPRTMGPPGIRPPMRRPAPRGGEVDNVLKKLREMGR